MEIKRQVEIKELKYPEYSFVYSQKFFDISKMNTLFSTLLLFMLSNKTSYGVETSVAEIPSYVGGLQVNPNYHSNNNKYFAVILFTA